jgi:hypothetical protein
MCALQPTASVPSRCRAQFAASPAAAECHAFASRVGWSPHRNRDLQRHNLAAVADARVHVGAAESHPPAPRLLANHFGSRRSGAQRAARLAHRRSDDACSHVWRDPSDWDRSSGRRTRRGWSSCRRSRVTNQCRLRARASSGGRNGSDPKCPALASRATVASRSYQSRSPVLEATLPRNSAAQHKQDASQTGAIGDSRTPTTRSRWRNRQERFDDFPQRVRQ